MYHQTVIIRRLDVRGEGRRVGRGGGADKVDVTASHGVHNRQRNHATPNADTTTSEAGEKNSGIQPQEQATAAAAAAAAAGLTHGSPTDATEFR